MHWPVLPITGPCRADEEIYLLVELLNHAEIEAMHGAEVAAQAFQVMHQKMLHWGAQTEALHETSVLARWQFKALVRLCGYHGFDAQDDDIACGLEMLQAQWSVDSLDVGGQHVLPLLAIHEVASPGEKILHALSAAPDLRPLAISSSLKRPPVQGRSNEWLERHRSDMNLAWRWHMALGQGRASLVLQPVRHSRTGEDLYHEALLRVADEQAASDAETLSAGMAVMALERLGLVRPLDRLVVSTVIDRLELETDHRLGCNISAASLKLDGWWNVPLQRLTARPDVAARLMVEVTETMPVTDLEAALTFLRKLKSLGCGIALDDVGSGYSSLSLAREIRPDVIKVDASLLHAERDSHAATSTLEKLVGYCQTLAAHVVLEGIEEKEDLALAQRVGAQWLQGYAIAMPAAPVSPMPVTGSFRC